VSCVFNTNELPFEIESGKYIQGYYDDEKNKSPTYRIEDKDERLPRRFPVQFCTAELHCSDPEKACTGGHCCTAVFQEWLHWGSLLHCSFLGYRALVPLQF
jgi:hypothetical protein